jgi:hypothetical protein
MMILVQELFEIELMINIPMKMLNQNPNKLLNYYFHKLYKMMLNEMMIDQNHNLPFE